MNHLFTFCVHLDGFQLFQVHFHVIMNSIGRPIEEIFIYVLIKILAS